MKRRGVHTIEVLGVLLVILFLIWCICAGWGWVYEAPFALAFGWPKYLWRVIPKLHPDPWSVVSAAVCLGGVTFGAHAFLRWLYGAMKTTPEETTSNQQLRLWPWKRTLQLVGLVVLMFVSGIAVTGMVHQTGWLVRSPEPLIRSSWDNRPSTVSQNNLKQIVLGTHEYLNTYVHLQQSSFDATGRPMHSWQTALLPFLEQGSLYQQIDQTKPWTDPANANAMSTPLKVFMHPAILYDLVSDQGVSHYAGNIHIVLSDTPKKLNDFPQGTANTILAGEVSSNFRAWGDPLNARDPRLGGSGHPNGFGGPNGKPALFAMLDGSVRSLDPKELAELVRKVPE
jgi:hypothetical protein